MWTDRLAPVIGVGRFDPGSSVEKVDAEVRQEVHEATAPDDKEDCEKAGRVWDNAGKTCVEKQ